MSSFLPDEIPVSELLKDTTSSFWLDDGVQSDDGDSEEDDDDDGYYLRVDHTRPARAQSDLILRRGRGMDQLDRWQKDSAKATWVAMRNIMPVEAWLAY